MGDERRETRDREWEMADGGWDTRRTVTGGRKRTGGEGENKKKGMEKRGVGEGEGNGDE